MRILSFVYRQALKLFCQYILQHDFIQAQISHQLLQFAVFFLQLPELFHVTGQPAAVLLLSAVEGLFADAYLAANLTKRGAMLHLFEYKRNLFFGKFLLPHFAHLATFILAFFSLKVDYFFRVKINNENGKMKLKN